MNIDNLSPDQLQKAFKLCDIMSLQDLFVAATILENYGWNVEKAVDQIAYTKQQENKPTYQNPYQNVTQNKITNDNAQQNYQNYNNQQNYDYNYDDQDPYHITGQGQQEDMVDYQDYEYEYAQNDIQRKKQMFQQNYASQLPLTKTTSTPHQMFRQLQKDKLLANDYHFHRHQYQTNLLKKSQQLFKNILQNKNSPNNSKHLYQANNRKIITNKKFIVYLHKVYKCKINFTFGTFMLNLIRSHLDNKYLLVFILHENSHNNTSKVVEKILNQPQIARFANKNSISYGMFDNSDDYQIVQKYLPLKDLPAFAIFKYNKKQQKQTFLSSYPLLNNQQENVLQWMAKWMGIPLKKKDAFKKPQQKMITQKQVEYEKISNILQDQNEQYYQMQKLYKIKRNQSRLNKQKIKQKQNHILQLKNYFNQNPQPQFVPGQCIQIKFRMPISGQSKMRIFKLEQKIQIMFDYIQAFYQTQFEEPFCQFDLTQTFPTLSLKDKRDKLIKEVFEESDRQNIIIKEV